MQTITLAYSRSLILVESSNQNAISSRRWQRDSALSERRRVTFAVSFCCNGRREEDFSALPYSVPKKLEMQSFASISSSSNCSTSTSGIPQLSVPSRASCIGSPLLWIGVGVALSATFSVRKAINEAFKAVMGEAAVQNGHFQTAAFSPGSPFPYNAESSSSPIAESPTPVSTELAEDVPAEKSDDNQKSENRDT